MTHLLAHLRRHTVAYVALLLVCSTGTAYAGGLANGSVTTPKLRDNAVTSAKIKNGAVTGADVKDRSIGAGDIAAGVVPGDGVIFADTGAAVGAPDADPDLLVSPARTVTVPRAGTVTVRVFISTLWATCGSGTPTVGVYLGEVAVPDTKLPVATSAGTARAVEMVGQVPVAAGSYLLSAAVSCASGSTTGGGANQATLTAWLPAS